MKTLTLELDTIATLTLNRPEVHNAFNDQMIGEFIEALKQVDADPSVRILVLKGAGKSFCAGADLNWMKSMAAYSEQENLEDSRKLDELMFTLNTLSKPTIALAHGNIYGGGVGLVACCDIALAEKGSKFCLSEAKLGLIPAIISPYVIEAIGARDARRYFQTAEVFDAEKANTLRLVHELYEGDGEELLNQITSSLLKCGPKAQAQAKKLVQDVSGREVDDSLRNDLATRIAQIRVSPEGQNGLQSFLNKEKPDWV